MAGFEPTTTPPQRGALPGCAISRNNFNGDTRILLGISNNVH